MQNGMGNIRNKPESQSQGSRSRLFEVVILKSWWAILFFLLCCFAYDQAAQLKTREEEKLRGKLHFLRAEKDQALENQENLKLQIASQEDESFIELTLMRRLGLVPEGQTKIHFISPP